ncbi:MAG: hypothetical protein CMO82_06250 [Winogradskyella sp.]|uniref:Outer membrane beta-barrel protein n=1 Tax=Winogradskyella poriferorum TaxID=307627 RepID=A0ABU7W865_9FLAO|nr:hypothetical protein [Winogradskyella sp.]|tara:strand:+ start:71 stop:634 length:564 start_codon:yes stop_codon:yes gene_type:complete
MKNQLIALLLVIVTYTSYAQSKYEKEINAEIGLGLTSPYESTTDIVSTGFFIQGEYVVKIKSWLELRPYAGFITTSSNGKDIDNNPTNEKVETKAFLLGGKARLRAPIPWVAPYLEVGIGGSIGKFETFTDYTNIEKSGFTYHIPIAFGLELGKNNGVDIGFRYFFLPSAEQFAGAFAVGISFPLKS